MAAAFGLLAGCTLFTDFSGLHEDGVTPEAGSDGSDAPATPTVPDSATSDASNDVTPPDAAAPSPCASPHRFCDDFDAPSLVLPGKWKDKRETVGPLSLDSVSFTSAPRSLRVDVTPGPGDRESYLETELVTSAKIVELGYDLRIAQFSNGSYKEIDFGVLVFRPNPSGITAQGLTIIKYPTQMVLEYFRQKNAGGFDADSVPITLPFDTWKRIAIRVDFSMSPAKGILEIDGQQAASIDLLTTTVSTVIAEVGINYSNDAQISTRVNVDNVTLDEL